MTLRGWTAEIPEYLKKPRSLSVRNRGTPGASMAATSRASCTWIPVTA